MIIIEGGKSLSDHELQRREGMKPDLQPGGVMTPQELRETRPNKGHLSAGDDDDCIV